MLIIDSKLIVWFWEEEKKIVILMLSCPIIYNINESLNFTWNVIEWMIYIL